MKKNSFDALVLYFSKGGNLIKFFKSIDSILLITITLLFIYDYFPNAPFADAIPKSVLLILILAELIVRFVFKKKDETDQKTQMAWQVIFTLYIIALMAVFPLLGGKSTTGLSFDNEIILIVILISLFDIYSKWKKAQRLKA